MDTENVAVHAISMPNQVFLVGGLGPGSPTPWLALTAPRVMVPDLEGRYTAYAIEGIEEVLRVHPGAAWAGLSGEPGCALLEAWRTAVGDVDVPPGDLDPSAPGTCVALPSLNLTSGSLLVGTWGTTDEQRAEGLIALTDVLTVAPLLASPLVTILQ